MLRIVPRSGGKLTMAAHCPLVPVLVARFDLSFAPPSTTAMTDLDDEWTNIARKLQALSIPPSRNKSATPSTTLDRLVREAQYELHVDAYRGIASNDPSSPWKHCECCDIQKQRGKQKSHNQRRRIPCDYNPFCWRSLGGVVEQALTNKEVIPPSLRPETQSAVNELRKHVWIDAKTVRDYLQRTLRGVMDVDQALARLRRVQFRLIFNDNHIHKFPLSMPPGIRNLGATCWLNTQLQCLAQNTVFLEGIFSWTNREHKDDAISTVVSLLQDLLARMKEGRYSTLDTEAFSKHLRLDIYEQQDPNEFAKLLLDRMVAQTGDLLPHLFQGQLKYEVTCSTCHSVSARTEDFMDLTLPIVRPKGQTTLLADTDVMTCLEAYQTPEQLQGDNQYHCAKCNAKRDATRTVVFDKLPPVLNLLLCRYVYDRVKYTKTKLSDKVSMPLEIQVDDKRYVLCAIMRHIGTAATQGHYVAEAMDWMTGQWFEFDDTKVSLLKEGPNCSYDPQSKTGKRDGSRQAYNLYYVEEQFLAQGIVDRLKIADPSDPSFSTVYPYPVVDDVVVDRDNQYDIVEAYVVVCSWVCWATFVVLTRVTGNAHAIEKWPIDWGNDESVFLNW